jgi:hypothetical protein
MLYLLGTGAVITTSLLPAGDQVATVHVTDDGGETVSASVNLEILPEDDPQCTNLPPQIVIAAPTDGQVVMASGVDDNGAYYDVTLSATVTDPEDDNNTLTVEWTSNRQGLFANGASTTGRLYMHETCSSEHTITATVIDSDGNQDEDAITFSIYVVC